MAESSSSPEGLAPSLPSALDFTKQRSSEREVLLKIGEVLLELAHSIEEFTFTAEEPRRRFSSIRGAVSGAVMTFPCDGKHHEFVLTSAKLAEYEDLFPKMDVIEVLKLARQWLIDNPTRRKTKNGMPKFILGWLSRQQDRGKFPLRKPRAVYDGKPPYEQNGFDSFESWRDSLRDALSDDTEELESALAFVAEKEAEWNSR